MWNKLIATITVFFLSVLRSALATDNGVKFKDDVSQVLISSKTKLSTSLDVHYRKYGWCLVSSFQKLKCKIRRSRFVIYCTWSIKGKKAVILIIQYTYTLPGMGKQITCSPEQLDTSFLLQFQCKVYNFIQIFVCFS